MPSTKNVLKMKKAMTAATSTDRDEARDARGRSRRRRRGSSGPGFSLAQPQAFAPLDQFRQMAGARIGGTVGPVLLSAWGEAGDGGRNGDLLLTVRVEELEAGPSAMLQSKGRDREGRGEREGGREGGRGFGGRDRDDRLRPGREGGRDRAERNEGEGDRA